MTVVLNEFCPVAHGVARIGDAWSLLILRDASQGLTRFDQFRKSLGIAPTILTKRLATLTEAGLLQKRQYSERPPRDEYLLTEAGRDFLPVLVMIGAWARRHHGATPLNRFADAETGEEIRPVVIDATTGAEIGTRPLKIVPA
nr:helix-turn-helix domain-containing protein [Rhodoblastus acidophilus]